MEASNAAIRSITLDFWTFGVAEDDGLAGALLLDQFFDALAVRVLVLVRIPRCAE